MVVDIEILKQTKCPPNHNPVWVVFAIRGGSIELLTVESSEEDAKELKEVVDKDDSYSECFIVTSMFNA